MASKIARRVKEFLVLTAFSEVVWTMLWTPFGILLNFDFLQWVKWIALGIPYDLVFAYLSSKIIVEFDRTAKKKGWY